MINKLIAALITGFLFSILFTACSVTKGKAERSADANFQLYFLIGQSNMAGRGYLDSLSKIPNPRILMLDKNNEWVPAKDPLHFDKKVAGVGPGMSFAQSMLDGEENNEVRIGLIPCAVGGTSINAWKPGGYDQATNTHPYDDAMKRVKAAMLKGVVKGVLWHQGEADASPGKREVYLDNLSELITRIRTELKQPELPFVAGEIGHFTESKKLFNEVLNALPQRVSNTKVVSSEGLTANPDNLHFNTSSARELGKRYAQAMKSLLVK